MKIPNSCRAPWAMVLWVIAACGLIAPQAANARKPDPSMPVARTHGPPAIISTSDLAGFSSLSAARKKLIETAIAVTYTFPWLPYVHGGAEPALGGMDCSGAMHYVMTRAGLTPPRTSSGQYQWLRDHQRLHRIPEAAITADHTSLAGLRPGDLIFWATTRIVDGEPVVSITHVAMYLGREKRDGLRVMINSTDGRSYRGTHSNGYGVYDFRMPRATSVAKLAGYGTPPGIPDVNASAAPP